MGDDYMINLRNLKQRKFKRNKDGFRTSIKNEIFILLVDSFQSNVTSLEQLKNIFLNEDIYVIMLDEIQKKENMTNQKKENITNQKLYLEENITNQKIYSIHHLSLEQVKSILEIFDDIKEMDVYKK